MPEEPVLSPRRRQLLDAAVHVVSSSGLRGLTHRAVDRSAGLPEGSTSAYYRTRRALLTALTEYVAAKLAADVEGLRADLVDCPPGVELKVALTTQLFVDWVKERELLLTRIELSTEASRDPDLAQVLGAWRHRLMGILEEMLAAQNHENVPQRAEILLAAFDGLLVSAMQRPTSELHEFLGPALTLLFQALGSAETPPA